MEALQRMSASDYAKITKLPLVVVLDNVRSGHNVGSIFRTGDAFLVDQVYLCGITPKPPHRDILKTALGASETVSWKYEENAMDAVQDLLSAGHEVWCIEQAEHVTLLDQWHWSGKPVALVLGNEVKGVDQEIINVSTGCIEIPQFGTKHSLNVSVCGGILIHHVSNKMRS